MQLLYFAWLRAKIGTGEERLEPPPEVATVTDLLDWLSGRGEGYAEALADRSVVRVAEGSAHSNHDGDFIVDFGTTADMCMDLSTV